MGSGTPRHVTLVTSHASHDHAVPCLPHIIMPDGRSPSSTQQPPTSSSPSLRSTILDVPSLVLFMSTVTNTTTYTRAEQRKLKLQQAEREQRLEEQEALVLTPEQLDMLYQPFMSVKFEFCDLDGMRWSSSGLCAPQVGLCFVCLGVGLRR